MFSSLRSRQRVTATQRSSQRTARNHAETPLKTLGFLVFCDGPSRGNRVNLETPLAPPGKPYGLLETWKIIGFPLHFHLELRMAD